MEPREQHVLQRYYERLIEQLEPKDFLKNLEILGACIDGFESVFQSLEGQRRQDQTEWLLENLRRTDQGMDCLVRGLLLSEIQDFLAREILEDESFGENDIGAFLESLKGQLSEVQILKLQLLKERKKNEDTKRQLDEIKSNRTSAVFSDYDSSCCSGFDGSDVGVLLRELDEERKRREEAERRTIELAETQKRFLRQFKSLEDLNHYKMCEKRFPWKAASVAELCSPDRTTSMLFQSGSEVTLTKWTSLDSGTQMRECSSCRNFFIEDENSSVLVLAEKVSSLEAQLEKEVNKREEAEFEVMKLECENRDLHHELFETQDQLFETQDQLFAASQMDLRENEDEDIWVNDEDNEFSTVRSDKWSVSSYEGFPLGKGISCPTLTQEDLQFNQCNVTLRQGGRRRSRPVSYHGDTGFSRAWQNRNPEHYEMDQYEEEIKKIPDPRDKDFIFELRKLKQDTWNLYNDVVTSGTVIRSLGNRAKRISLGK